MQLSLKKCLSPENQLYKKFGAETLDVNFKCKEPVSLYDPLIILETPDDISKYNYAFISEWGRYYFLDPHNVEAIHENIYSIRLRCDSLSTFADQVVAIPCIIDRTESAGGSPYLRSEAHIVNCKHKTDILNFPNGLNDTGEFILITAGG